MSAAASETAIAPALVVLKGGLSVPLEALKLAWRLEDRGAVFLVDGSELVVDAPRGGLTDQDCSAIRQWKGSLMAIANYRVPEVLE